MWSSILCLINFFILLNVTFGQYRDRGEISTDSIVPKIANGTFAGERSFPYAGFFVNITDEPDVSIRCGGSIIHPRWVLTAGHCCEEAQVGVTLFVAGTRDVGLNLGSSQVRKVVRFFSHENISYTHEWKGKVLVYVNRNDIGLARLNASLKIDGYIVKIILLNQNKKKELINKSVIYMGWGATRNYDPSVMSSHTGKGKIISYEACKQNLSIIANPLANETMEDIDEDTNICTYDSKNKSATCEGDSGSPLTFNDLQIAVTTDVFCDRRPSVFVKVADFFDWIRSKLALCGDEIYDNYGKSAKRGYKNDRLPRDDKICSATSAPDCKRSKTPPEPVRPFVRDAETAYIDGLNEFFNRTR